MANGKSQMVNGKSGSAIHLPFAICLLPFAMVLAVLFGCKSPFDRTKDASNGGGTGTLGTSPAFVIFSSELKSGGGAFLYPGSDGQSLSFDDTSNPLTYRSIRYSWTGEAVSNLACLAQNPTHNFAGFDLMFKPTQAEYDASPVGVDLRQANYTKLTFYARGSLSTNNYIKVEVATPGTTNACLAVPAPCIKLLNGADPAPTQDTTCSSGQLTSAWSQYTITVPNSALANIRDFFKSTFVFVDPFVGNLQPGQGGTVFYDKIQYEQ